MPAHSRFTSSGGAARSGLTRMRDRGFTWKMLVAWDFDIYGVLSLWYTTKFAFDLPLRSCLAAPS